MNPAREAGTAKQLPTTLRGSNFWPECVCAYACMRARIANSCFFVYEVLVCHYTDTSFVSMKVGCLIINSLRQQWQSLVFYDGLVCHNSDTSVFTLIFDHLIANKWQQQWQSLVICDGFGTPLSRYIVFSTFSRDLAFGKYIKYSPMAARDLIWDTVGGPSAGKWPYKAL